MDRAWGLGYPGPQGGEGVLKLRFGIEDGCTLGGGGQGVQRHRELSARSEAKAP